MKNTSDTTTSVIADSEGGSPFSLEAVSQLYITSEQRAYVKELLLSDLMIDPSMQRTHVRAARVESMVKKFNPDALGVLEVSQRLTGDTHVLDGYHRVLMLRRLFETGKIDSTFPVLCKVFVGLSPQQEALLFGLLNDKEKVGPKDRFRLRLKAEDPMAVELARLLKENGWSVNRPVGSDGSFAAIASLESAYRRNPVAAEKSLRTLTRAWGHNPSSVNGSLVAGLGLFYGYYGNSADLTRVVNKFIGYPKGARAYLAAGQGMKDLIKGTTENAIASLTVDLYNLGLSSTKLSPWERNGKRDGRRTKTAVPNTVEKELPTVVIQDNTVSIPALEEK